MSLAFNYKARNLSGRMMGGRIQADSLNAAMNLLRQKNYFVLEIKPIRTMDFSLGKLLGLKIKTKELAVFCRQFATMSSAGIPLLQCLNILAQQTEAKNLKEILQDVTIQIEKGKSLSEAFREHKNSFPEIFINMLVAGELSGTIDQSLSRLALHFEKDHELREKIRSAMTYPIFVSGMAFVAMIFLIVFIVPIFVDIFNSVGAALPLPTRIVIAISSAITKFWYLLIILPVAAFFGLRKVCSTEKGRSVVDHLVLKVPILGQMNHKLIVARFARTLSTLLRSGVPLMQSLETLERIVGNSIASKEIAAARQNIKEGEKMSPVLLKSRIFPLMAGNMISIGEESGALDELLEKLAVFYEQDVEYIVARFSSLIEPVMIAVVGAMIAFIAISIYLPLFQMSGVLGQQAGM